MRSVNWVRLLLMTSLAVCAIGPAFAQSVSEAADQQKAAGLSVPAGRQADRVVVITLAGAIDQWTERSVKRRIEQAESSGADAIVIEVDSPGGEVGAVLEICNAIKGSSIDNTVAWVNTDAYSGGAIVALACRELVTSVPARMGDAFPITFGPQGVRGLSPDERTKFLPPLLTEVADSARRNGYDEFLVQAMVVDGIELWSVEDSQTGDIWFINEAEYRTLFEGDPPRGKPALTSVTGGRASTQGNAAAPAAAPNPGTNPGTDPETGPETDDGNPDSDPASDDRAEDDEAASSDTQSDPLQTPPSGEGMPFRPASPTVADLTDSASQGLTAPSTRPNFTEADRGRFINPRYIADGTGPIVLTDDQLLAYGFTSRLIGDDAELLAFFGGKELVRTEPTWSENMVKAMMNPIARGVLIVVLLVGLFIEMASPGLIVPGAVAGAALVGLLAPPMLVGMAGWWELAAISIGVVCLLLELLVFPGFGVFGIIGVVALFAGMVGTFIPDGSGGLFSPASSDDLFGGVATVLLSTSAAAVAIFFLSKHFGSLPLLSRLVLADVSSEESDSPIMAMEPEDNSSVAPGDRGVAASDLRPSGRALFNGEMVDAIAERGYIEDGDPVEVVARRGFSWVVRPARERAEQDDEPERTPDGRENA